jgi:hypothetical protein
MRMCNNPRIPLGPQLLGRDLIGWFALFGPIFQKSITMTLRESR